MIETLKCFVSEHPKTETKEYRHLTIESCTRCGTTVSSEPTYYGRANRWLRRNERYTFKEPVAQIEDANGKILRPGDRIRYHDYGRQAFPGIHLPTTGFVGTVEFIYEDRMGERWIKIEEHWNKLVSERRLVGIQSTTDSEDEQ